jgi:hypothetical protein
MKHQEHEIQEPEPVGLAKKLFLYTVAGAVFYGLAVLIFVR